MRLLSHILGLAVVVVLALVLLYMTRFWTFTDWWSDGLFGVKELSPQGNLIHRQLGGTPYQPYALLFWLAGGFLVLSLLQWIATGIGSLFRRN